MSSNNKQEGGFAVTVIFILSILVLMLIFVLFTRDQGNKQVAQTITSLATTNQELKKVQKTEKAKSLSDRLEEVGIDAGALWMLGDCEVPYCRFTSVVVDGDKEEELQSVLAIERWDGYFEKYVDRDSECGAFVFNNGQVRGINMETLASVEKNLITTSDKDNPIGLTVFIHDDQKFFNVCENNPIVLNVHFE